MKLSNIFNKVATKVTDTINAASGAPTAKKKNEIRNNYDIKAKYASKPEKSPIADITPFKPTKPASSAEEMGSAETATVTKSATYPTDTGTYIVRGKQLVGLDNVMAYALPYAEKKITIPYDTVQINPKPNHHVIDVVFHHPDFDGTTTVVVNYRQAD